MMRSQSSVPREILNLVWEHCTNNDVRTMQANCKPRLFRVGVIDEPYCTLTVNLSDYGYVFKNGIIAIDYNVLFMSELLNVFIKTFCVEDFVMPVHYGFANSILVQLLPEVFEKIKENIVKEELEEKT